MRTFKDVKCPACHLEFPVGFSEEEQRAEGKNVVCRNQKCRIRIWAPTIGHPKLIKIGKIDW